MRISRFVFLFLALANFPTAGFAQAIPAVVKSQPDTPIQITNSECSAAQTGGARCKATLTVNPSGLWTAYGLRWKLTYENGRSIYSSSVADVSLLPEISGGAFKPGEVKEHQTGGFGMRAPDGKDLRLASAEVEVAFVVSALGKTWGNTKSVNYARLMAKREGFAQAMDYLRSVYCKQGREATLKALGVP